jgi:hypothetical protein
LMGGKDFGCGGENGLEREEAMLVFLFLWS